MPDRVIENPIINSPYREPSRHFLLDQDGITNEVAERRRRSAYFVPVPKARKQAAHQLELVTEWTLDRIRENREINEIRAKVQLWRRRGYPYGPKRDWVRNVLAAGRCALVRGGRRFELTDPRLLDAAGAAPLLPAPLRPALRVVPGIHFVRLSAAGPEQRGAQHAGR